MLRYQLCVCCGSKRSSRPDNTAQWIIHRAFPFGSGMCIYTLSRRRVPRAPPPLPAAQASCSAQHRSLAWPCRWHLWPGTDPAWPCHWHLWPGEAAGGDSAWCLCDLSRACTALLQTHDLILSPMKQAGKAHAFYGESQHARFCHVPDVLKGAPCMVDRMAATAERWLLLRCQ